MRTQKFDVIIIGAGAAGLMCAIEAGKRGRRVWLMDHAKKTAEKIRISGGGRCNFTNIHTSAEKFLSSNPHFCKSALAQYTQYDFIDLVKKHGIDFHEKTLGQLFCDGSSQQIIDMLVKECKDAGVRFTMETPVSDVTCAQSEGGENIYTVQTAHGAAQSPSLVIATGGLSIPKIGATRFGYDIAKQFNIDVLDTWPALVPFTFQSHILERCKTLTGLSVDASISCNGTEFRESMLFTHRGLSGPSILQISSYWNEGDAITLNFAPDTDVATDLIEHKEQHPKQDIVTALSNHIPKRLATWICADEKIAGRIADLSHKALEKLAVAVNAWEVKPAGTEGYRTAEVTLRGVNTNEISSKTMEAKKQKGLFFIGEVLDVTGHLGGYNFQWAWSSGYVAGQYV